MFAHGPVRINEHPFVDVFPIRESPQEELARGFGKREREVGTGELERIVALVRGCGLLFHKPLMGINAH